MISKTAILVSPAPELPGDVPGLAEALGRHHLALESVPEAEAGKCLASLIGRSGEPELAIFSPGVRRPIQIARQIVSLAPSLQLLFLTDHATEKDLQRQLSLAPMIGNHWSIGSIEDEDLDLLTTRSLQSARQARQLRTTLDRANLRLAAESVRPGSRYRSLVLSDRYLRSVLDQARDAIIGTDTRGVVTSVNRSGERLFRKKAADLTGRHVSELCGGDWKNRLVRILGSLGDSGTAELEEITCRHGNGSTMAVEASVGRVTDETGALLGFSIIARDLTARKQAEEQSRQSSQRTDAFFRQAAVGIALVELGGRFVQVNERYCEIVGRNSDELLQLRMQDITDPDDIAENLILFRRLIEEDTPFSLEKRYLRPDGSHVWVHNTVSAVTGSDGRPQSIVAVTVDITAKREAEAARMELARQRESLLESERAARASAERNSRMKDEFLATLSHELRTPLNAVLGWSQIVKKDAQRPEIIQQGIEVIERNARAQAQIIEDLLDMSRIISGKVRLDVQRLDLAATVKAAVETGMPAAEAKGIRLISVIDPLRGVSVTGDVNRIQQVLWNLISNALKFTPKGGRVQVLLERVNSHVEISVIDNGEGIKTEFLPHVFDRFRQEDASTTRRHGGLGLGLSIVRNLVELHGGSVRVKSAGQGQGATFIVALPLTAVQPDPAEEQERRHPSAGGAGAETAGPFVNIAGLRVLVVDDEPDARGLVSRVLEDFGAHAVSAGSAAEALDLVRGSQSFDVLVSDIGMPGQDGYDLIRSIRSLPGGQRSIPAIALTAYARSEDRVKALAAGFLMHLSKPVEPAELVAMVAAATGRISS